MIKVIKKDQQTSDTLNRYAALNTLKSRKQTGTYDAAIKDAMWQAKKQRIPVYFYGEDKFGAWFWRNTTNESDINPNKSSGSRILKIVYDDIDGFSLYDCEIAEELSHSGITEHPVEPSEYDVKPIPKKKAKKEEKVLTLKQKLHGAGVRDMKQVKQIEKNVDQYVKMMQSAKSVVEKDGAYIITTKDGGTHRVSGIIGDYAYRRTFAGSEKSGHKFSDDDMNRIYTAALFAHKKVDGRTPKNELTIKTQSIGFVTIADQKCVYGTDKKVLYVSLLEYPDFMEGKSILVYGEENFLDRLKQSDEMYADDGGVILGDYYFEFGNSILDAVHKIVPDAEDIIQSVTIEENVIKQFKKSKKRIMKNDIYIYFSDNLVSFGEYNGITEGVEKPFKVLADNFIKSWEYLSPETVDIYHQTICMSGESEFAVIAKIKE